MAIKGMVDCWVCLGGFCRTEGGEEGEGFRGGDNGIGEGGEDKEIEGINIVNVLFVPGKNNGEVLELLPLY